MYVCLNLFHHLSFSKKKKKINIICHMSTVCVFERVVYNFANNNKRNDINQPESNNHFL